MARAWAVVVASALVFAGAAGAQPGGKRGDGKDDVVGTIWQYELSGNGKQKSGQFRVSNLEVFRGANKVGTVRPKDADETTILITGMVMMNGTAVLRKTGRKPAVWKGAFLMDDGTKWDMRVTVKDK